MRGTWTESRSEPHPGDVGSGGAGESEALPAAWAAPVYIGFYLAYLFVYQEAELEHWIGMVLLPLSLVLAVRLAGGGDPDRSGSGVGGREGGVSAPLRDSLASFGIRRDRLTRGWIATLILGLVLGLVQVRYARAGEAFEEAVRSGRAIWLIPLAFVLLLFLTGFTEEFFFRGFLQSRFQALTRSRWMGLALATLAFAVYHVPYAYFNPAWPSAGDWGAAWSTGMWEGALGGLVFGGLFLWSRGNLLACVVLHALVDAFPASALIRFGGS